MILVTGATGNGPLVGSTVTSTCSPARVGNLTEILPTVEQVTGRPPFTYAQWVADHAADFGAASP